LLVFCRRQNIRQLRHLTFPFFEFFIFAKT
jgi:hypothetical protein